MELTSSWFEEDGWVDHRLRGDCGESGFLFEVRLLSMYEQKVPRWLDMKLRMSLNGFGLLILID